MDEISTCLPMKALVQIKHGESKDDLFAISSGKDYECNREICWNIIYIFTGQYELPVSCMKQPDHQFLLRKPNDTFIQLLKKEIISNPMKSVALMIGMVLLNEGEDVDTAHMEAYSYDTIGKLYGISV